MTLAGIEFEHAHHAVMLPPLQHGRDLQRKRVLVAGGGPVGLATALALAHQGTPCLVVEADTTVCIGSRAICLSRRTLEILDRLGALAPLVNKGLPWTGGRSFHRDQLVLHFTMPHDEDQRLAPMTNIQQYYVEQYLLEAVESHRDLIEVRWGTRVSAVRQDEGGVVVDLEAGSVAYSAEADYLVACDGARSQVRQNLGLRMTGTAYEGRYVIVDIALEVDLPTERMAWFDPPSNPGRTMLMHRQPDGVWRLDYQLAPREDSEEVLRSENVTAVVKAHLAMIGVDAPWTLIWKSIYRAAAVSLESYRHGRVLFAGDAAHLVPIFGVRGLNSGFDDAFNLGWKLDWVARGIAPSILLDTYSEERHAAWVFNVAHAMKSTEFMSPPSRGFELMRDAVLGLAKGRPELATLINPRQSSVVVYEQSRLSTVTPDDASFAGVAVTGGPLPECPLRALDGRVAYLTASLTDGFNLLLFADGSDLMTEIRDEILRVSAEIPLTFLVLVPPGEHAWVKGVGADNVLVDEAGRADMLLDARPGTAYLVRPDGHVCARWRQLLPGRLSAAVARALGQTATGMH